MLVITKSGSFEINEEDSLLETLEKNGYVIEYQCRSGYCGACRIKMKKGKVTYSSPPLACINDDEILACCCIVKEDLLLDVTQAQNTTASYQKDLFNLNLDLFDSIKKNDTND